MAGAAGDLGRDGFRSAVFERDRGRCVACGAAAVDAHHLLERRLWADGGYRVDNGVAVCGPCHLAAERTVLSVEDLRVAAGIMMVALPAQCDPSVRWDKWGNPFLPAAQAWVPGELFDTEPVRQALRASGRLMAFAPWVPPAWRPAGGGPAGPQEVIYRLPGAEAVVVYSGGTELRWQAGSPLAAAALGGCSPSTAELSSALPAGWRVEGRCGPAGLVAETVWDGRGLCLPWEDTLEWLQLLGVPGPGGAGEVTVVRSKEGFAYRDARRVCRILEA